MIDASFIKVAYQVLKEANRLDLAEKIVDLREEVLELREENMRLRGESSDLRESLKIKSKIIHEGGVFWIVGDEATLDKRNSPICPKCWQIDKAINRIVPTLGYTGQVISGYQRKQELGINCRIPGHNWFTITDDITNKKIPM